MSADGLRIRSLSFHGPSRAATVMRFDAGLNVIYGASNTGKSFIVDTIDFMLGGRGPLRDIPERVGYDKILLGMETLDEKPFTLVRGTAGGAFTLFEGLHDETLPTGSGVPLADVHNDRRDDNLSAFLLAKLALSHRRIRRNQRGDTQSLSFRNLARLVIVNEEEIIQQRSPLSDGNYTADTANTAAFKLLLTGVDDSALVTGKHQTPEHQARGAQLDLLDQMIGEYRNKIKELAGPPSELEDQLGRLESTMSEHGQQLSVSEVQYREMSGERRALLKRIEEGRNRLTEIRNLVDRFGLLEQHYRSDIERLQAIAEAGNLFAALGETACPFCGALPENHRMSAECEGNVDQVVASAEAEISKIEMRQGELSQTILTLEKEARSFERRLPRIEESAEALSSRIQSIVTPTLRRLRNTYGDLADKRSEVREALGFYDTLRSLEERKQNLEKEDVASGSSSNIPDVELSSSTVDKFSTVVLDLLKAWHFPGVDRVHFDMKTRDLVINGKLRTSFGKGLRAITQAAFTIGLLEYSRREDTPHPGFVVVDSPLLSYREPDNPDDDLTGTDLNTHFYSYLEATDNDRQVIVIENTDPPSSVRSSSQVVRFTGLKGDGRYGLFGVEN